MNKMDFPFLHDSPLPSVAPLSEITKRKGGKK